MIFRMFDLFEEGKLRIVNPFENTFVTFGSYLSFTNKLIILYATTRPILEIGFKVFCVAWCTPISRRVDSLTTFIAKNGVILVRHRRLTHYSATHYSFLVPKALYLN